MKNTVVGIDRIAPVPFEVFGRTPRWASRMHPTRDDNGHNNSGGDGGSGGEGGSGNEGGGSGNDGGNSGKSGEGKTSTYTPPATQEEFDRIITQRANRAAAQKAAEFGDYDKYKADSEELAKLRDGQKTEAQKEKERADKLAADLASYQHKELQAAVAAEKGVPVGQAHRLVGKNRAELEADADKYLEDHPANDGGGDGRRPKPNGDQGKGGGGKAKSVDAGRDLWEQTHKKKSDK